MSLLLDALKKAADEKNKAADSVENSVQDAVSSQTGVEEIHKEKQGKSEHTDKNEDFDLSLDEEALNTTDQPGESIDAYKEKFQTGKQVAEKKNTDEQDRKEEYDRLSEVVSVKASKEGSDRQTDQAIRLADRAGGNLDYEVSDEALELLIHKTNRSYKKTKIIWVLLISVLSLTVLVAGGVYFTEEMQSELAFLETRHQQSMRTVREKTGKESLPDKSVIIENLVGEGDLAKKVEFTKEELLKEKKQKQLNGKKESIEKKKLSEEAIAGTVKTNEYARKAVLSIEKNQQTDPVSLLLDEAWLAYQEGKFDLSDHAYEKVLQKEKNNRDALLGRGAIALEKKDYAQAKKFYLALLEINPKDPDAVSALTGLTQKLNVQSEQVGVDKNEQSRNENYLKDLLQGNKQSPVLNFSLGSLYAEQQRWKLAQEYFFKAWVNDSNNPGYAYNLAVSLDQMGKSREAKQYYQECLRLSENKKVRFSKQSVVDRIVQIK